MEFDRFVISKYGTMAGSYEYVVTKIDGGVKLEYAFVNSYWDDKVSDYVDKKTIIRSVIKGDNAYQEILNLINECKVLKWNGFHKSNSNVLDGGGFSFTLESKGEMLVKASGSNSFPKYYGDFVRAIHDMILTEKVQSNELKTNHFTCQLPDSWLNCLYARYNEDYVAYFFKVNGEDKTLFVIYDTPYSFDEFDKYSLITKLKNDNEDLRYIHTTINNLEYIADKLNDKEQLVLNNIQDDVKIIENSIEPINGYKFKVK